MYTTLIATGELLRHLEEPNWIIVDCRFDLDDTESGSASYERGHLPGAVYAHLDHDLSGPPLTDAGRHPLPSPERLAETFGRWGIDRGSQVVVYDDNSGMYACRLWWMLRYMRHEAVALLDGGLAEWRRAGGPIRAGREERAPREFVGEPRSEWLVVKSQVNDSMRLIDSRDALRYRGVGETRDPRAGHIPGALNHPWRDNLGENGCFLPPEAIRTKMNALLHGSSPEEAVFYCGSGVTACANAFASFLAGVTIPRVYVGSFSEWSRDPSAPVA